MLRVSSARKKFSIVLSPSANTENIAHRWEIDLSAAIASLKAIMNQRNVIFILTTNHLNKITSAVQNRCHLFDMNEPPPTGWVTKIQSIYQQSNLQAPPAATISTIVSAGNVLSNDNLPSAKAGLSISSGSPTLIGYPLTCPVLSLFFVIVICGNSSPS